MADDGYTYARPDAEEIDEPDPTFDVLTDYTVDLDNPIGVGGFGSVHFGCQRSTRKMVAVKAVSKARTQQVAERGAAHTSAEEILKMEIEVMRDLSETRHRNMCAAAQPPPNRSRPPTAAAFVPLPAHRRHPTASPPLSRRRRHCARASPHAQHTPRPIPGPTPGATPRPRRAPAPVQPEVLRLRGGRPVRVPHSAAVHGRRAAGLAAPAVRAGALHRADRRQGRVRRAAGARVRMHAHACACARACTACLWLRSRPRQSPRPSSSRAHSVSLVWRGRRCASATSWASCTET